MSISAAPISVGRMMPLPRLIAVVTITTDGSESCPLWVRAARVMRPAAVRTLPPISTERPQRAIICGAVARTAPLKCALPTCGRPENRHGRRCRRPGPARPASAAARRQRNEHQSETSGEAERTERVERVETAARCSTSGRKYSNGGERAQCADGNVDPKDRSPTQPCDIGGNQQTAQDLTRDGPDPARYPIPGHRLRTVASVRGCRDCPAQPLAQWWGHERKRGKRHLDSRIVRGFRKVKARRARRSSAVLLRSALRARSMTSM